jgi:hypothetical protein
MEFCCKHISSAAGRSHRQKFYTVRVGSLVDGMELYHLPELNQTTLYMLLGRTRVGGCYVAFLYVRT